MSIRTLNTPTPRPTLGLRRFGIGMVGLGTLTMLAAIGLAGLGLRVAVPKTGDWHAALQPLAVFGPGALALLVCGMAVAARRCSVELGSGLAALVLVTPFLVADPALRIYGIATGGVALSLAAFGAMRSRRPQYALADAQTADLDDEQQAA